VPSHPWRITPILERKVTLNFVRKTFLMTRIVTPQPAAAAGKPVPPATPPLTLRPLPQLSKSLCSLLLVSFWASTDPMKQHRRAAKTLVYNKVSNILPFFCCVCFLILVGLSTPRHPLKSLLRTSLFLFSSLPHQ